MGHLAINHTIHALNSQSYETIEVTGPQMVPTMKLTTFTWNVHNGRRPSDELNKWQSSKCITTYPSLLSFLSYSFYFPSLLIGPYLDFTRRIHGLDAFTWEEGAAYVKVVMGFAYLGTFVVLGGSWNFSTALKPEFAKMRSSSSSKPTVPSNEADTMPSGPPLKAHPSPPVSASQAPHPPQNNPNGMEQPMPLYPKSNSLPTLKFSSTLGI
ncbi:hypothetical protein D9756_004493 [Leucocoprinus leucothites]|uniref:Uncharacterized protein n=1 Tax=Leucocoprinus leucothites TaxID=201217 RepID=A0A8H5G9Z2_9AGAR|nr:hypothetical protein D9756_004493 [Leucoagaricus leucothites]